MSAPQIASVDDSRTESRGALKRSIVAAFREMVLDPVFPCLGAKSAVHLGHYSLEVYGSLGSDLNAAALTRDIAEFSATSPPSSTALSSFVAVFPDDPPNTEAAFERRLWKELQLVHEQDARDYAWTREAAADPEDAKFSFSVSGRAFFVVGLHPHSSRLARRFPWPALVFNPHSQFMHLRDTGRFDGLRSAIRARDLNLQGSPNPNLADFGESSEARQYSGRATPAEWKCPFHRKQD
jgi:FPC/CPF motif-containing protein YcgG